METGWKAGGLAAWPGGAPPFVLAPHPGRPWEPAGLSLGGPPPPPQSQALGLGEAGGPCGCHSTSGTRREPTSSRHEILWGKTPLEDSPG